MGSKTPLTDAVAGKLVGAPFKDGEHPLVDHARRLESALALAEGALLHYTGVVESVNDPKDFTEKVSDAGNHARDALLAIEKLKEGNHAR